LWFTQRLNYRLAETEKIKNTKTLIALTDAANHSEQPINPLVIISENQLFKENAPQEIPNFPNLTAASLAEKLAVICKIQNLANVLNRHIGPNSTYQQKKSLKNALQVVYRRLNGDFDPTLGPLPEKAMLIEKLIEGLDTCTQGFHNRVNTILESFQKPQNFSELLYLVRKQLVEKTAISLMHAKKTILRGMYEIHTFNDFTLIAQQAGLGIKPNFAEDIFRGDLDPDDIKAALQSEFENSYTLFNLPRLLVEALRGILIEVGYSGSKKKPEGYNATTFDDEVEKFTLLIRKYLGADFQNIDWQDFFILDEESFLVLDVNWKLIEEYFFKQLLKENYFTIPSFDNISENLLQLLAYKNSQDWNYVWLLARYAPETLKLLFYYLRAQPNSVTEKIKEQLIPLFFKKNNMGQHVVQLAAQHHPDTLIPVLDFIDEHINKFDLDFNDFMRTEKYHPESLKLMLDFTEKHLTHADKQTIRAFFLKKNDSGWNTFINATQNQPETALAILNYIIKHPEMFIAETSAAKSLFEENLPKIQQGLSNLMAIKKPDSERINTLLKFISLYPELLANKPKKLAHFIFASLAIIHDKKLIDAIVVSHAALLLKYFSINYFKEHNKNLVTIIEKLLCAYSAELTTRKNKNITYTSQFFKQPVGYTTNEKEEALQALIEVIKNSPDNEKTEKVKSLKISHPALSNGRLSQLFKACCNNDAITQPIQIEFQH
jgi:hypothetical protein